MTTPLSVYAALTLAPLEVQTLLSTIEKIPGTKILTLVPRAESQAPTTFTVSALNHVVGGSLDELLASLAEVLQTAGGLLIRQQTEVTGALPFHTPTSWAMLYGVRLEGGTWHPVSADYLLASRGAEVEFSPGDSMPVLCNDLAIYCTPPRQVADEPVRQRPAHRREKGAT